MTDQDAIRSDTLGDDIAFMRALAEEGRQVPIVDGRILVVSGLCFGSSSLAIWVSLTFNVLVSRGSFVAIWMIGLVGFLGFLFSTKGRQGPRATPSRAIGVAWSAAGWSIFFVGLSIAVMAARGKDSYVTNAFLPFVLSIYGSAWFVAAAMTRARWLFGVAFGAFAFALVTAWFASLGVVVFLVYALGLYTLVAAPGWVLMRQARRAVPSEVGA
jgi:hypothetical protein